MYAIQQRSPDLWQITLPKPSISSLPYARPNHVYVITGRWPTLINVGHTSQRAALAQALGDAGLRPAQITRVIATSWDPDILGGAAHLPDAEVFAFSPDLQAPSDYGAWQAQEREVRLAFARELVEQPGYTRQVQLGDYAALLDAYFDPGVHTLPIAPLRAGHWVAAGSRLLEVIAAPGPDEGHIILHEAASQTLWTGDLLQEGLPERLRSVQDFLTGMERAQALRPKTLLPNRGPISQDGAFTLRYSARFLNSFVTNAPLAMHKGPTLLEFVARDLGMEPSDELRYIETLRGYHLLLEELGRARLLDTQGVGLSRRYGVDLNDPRTELRR